MLRPYRIHSIPRRHRCHHPFPTFRDLNSSPPIISRLPLCLSQFLFSAGVLACSRISLRLYRPNSPQASRTGALIPGISRTSLPLPMTLPNHSDSMLSLPCTFHPYPCTILRLHDLSFLIPSPCWCFFWHQISLTLYIFTHWTLYHVLIHNGPLQSH